MKTFSDIGWVDVRITTDVQMGVTTESEGFHLRARHYGGANGWKLKLLKKNPLSQDWDEISPEVQAWYQDLLISQLKEVLNRLSTCESEAFKAVPTVQ